MSGATEWSSVELRRGQGGSWGSPGELKRRLV